MNIIYILTKYNSLSIWYKHIFMENSSEMRVMKQALCVECASDSAGAMLRARGQGRPRLCVVWLCGLQLTDWENEESEERESERESVCLLLGGLALTSYSRSWEPRENGLIHHTHISM